VWAFIILTLLRVGHLSNTYKNLINFCVCLCVCERERKRERIYRNSNIHCLLHKTYNSSWPIHDYGKKLLLDRNQNQVLKKGKRNATIIIFSFQKCFISAFVDHKAKKGLNIDKNRASVEVSCNVVYCGRWCFEI